MTKKRALTALILCCSFTLGAVSVNTAEAVAKYVTQKQRVKDLTDIAKQLVKLQNRIQYLENCIENLTVNPYSTGNIKTVNC